MSPLEMYAAFSATFMTPLALVLGAQVLVDDCRWPKRTVTVAGWLAVIAWLVGFGYMFSAGS